MAASTLEQTHRGCSLAGTGIDHRPSKDACEGNKCTYDATRLVRLARGVDAFPVVTMEARFQIDVLVVDGHPSSFAFAVEDIIYDGNHHSRCCCSNDEKKERSSLEARAFSERWTSKISCLRSFLFVDDDCSQLFEILST